MRTVRTTCAYCGVGCGIAAGVTGERSVQIKGDGAHPANAGKLCSKGTHLGETVSPEGRLLHPVIAGRTAGWGEALDLVSARLKACIEEHGPDSVAFYVSGQLLTEDYYVANKLMKGFIGSGNIDTNSRLCMASAVAAHNRAFGEDVVPCSYTDLEEADLVVLVGSNTAWCHPVLWQRIEESRARRGSKIVVIDPRRTETAEQADLHVAVAPDGDVALFNAVLRELKARGLVDEAYLAQHVAAPEGFWDGLEGSAESAGVSPEVFEQLVDLVAAHPKMVTMFSMGANQSAQGTDKGNAITNLHLATGRIGLPGTGPFSITGQPNAMGGREVGGLANMLACHLGFSGEELAEVADFWAAERICTGPGLKAVEMFRAVHDGRIKFLWVMATNPAVSLPDAGFVREALERCETLVVSEAIADTDTGRFAEILLPALAWGEKDGTVTNSERRVSRQRALFAAPGQAKSDWKIMSEVAARLGWGDAFAWANSAAVFREYAAMTALAAKRGKVLDLTDKAGLSDEEYEDMAPFQWGGALPLRERYPTADGKARLIAVAPIAASAVDPAFPLILNTGRYRDQWHTMTRTGWSPTLAQHRREPLAEVHPADAALYDIADAGLVKITTPSGTATFRVKVTDSQRRGEVFVPMHWTDVNAGEGRANRLPSQRVDPVSGQPGFKNSPARIEAVLPEWRAFLVVRELVAPEGLLWWTRSAVKGGWLMELAGLGTVDVSAMLPAGERIEVADHVRGMRRIAVTGADGSLEAALYLTRRGVLPSREWVAGQLGLSEANADELLAARPSVGMPDRGPVVCVCHGIGENDIAACGASTVAEVGQCTRAGTNCGSCRPAIAKLLQAMQLEAAE
ncbi:nitrate reductase [Novosphingobium flavum]|uniref:Nitrate reductase n=1 Tax=Novosphingobium flavum TaxID=1778672 RepID=A0A7X1FNJ8_9SPHN|nr:nitrate reductase [Novosphingobium flavum]MBC2664059.1 nitrate reductase [Novosphingobium flavum]